jgi:hypothetical protein
MAQGNIRLAIDDVLSVNNCECVGFILDTSDIKEPRRIPGLLILSVVTLLVLGRAFFNASSSKVPSFIRACGLGNRTLENNIA